MAKAKATNINADAPDNRKTNDGVNTANGLDPSDPYEVREYVETSITGSQIITRKIVLKVTQDES